MGIFSDKDLKKLFIILIAVLLSTVILGQIAARFLAEDYKSKLMDHDYTLAGYLVKNGMDKSVILEAFTSDKTDEEYKAGQELLAKAGYQASIATRFLPEVKSVQHQYALLFLIASLILIVVILTIIFIYARHQDKKLQTANEAIMVFRNGDISRRLEDNEEGSLGKLFASVNSLATSLTSHVAKEKENKEFLKDTISDISHQLKTPLAALQMYNEIIQDENTENNVVADFTVKSENELKRMEDLIQNLLKLARLDAGVIELERQNHSLQEFLSETVHRFSTQAEVERKSLHLTRNDSITLYFDKGWLGEAIGNLIKNALEHTVVNDKIEISYEETPVVIRIVINDSGQGIHPEDIHHIFKRFYRSRFSQDRQGVGIGLSLSKAIVEKHGGSLTVMSELGRGTTFAITFPKLTNL